MEIGVSEEEKGDFKKMSGVLFYSNHLSILEGDTKIQ